MYITTCAKPRPHARHDGLPALVVMAWVLAGSALLLAGRFTPVLMLVVSVPLAAVLVVLGLRWIPDRWEGTLPVPRPDRARTPWWAVAGVIAVAVAFGVHQMIYHSQQIIILRDPGAYIQFGAWIAHHGSLPITLPCAFPSLADVGGQAAEPAATGDPAGEGWPPAAMASATGGASQTQRR